MYRGLTLPIVLNVVIVDIFRVQGLNKVQNVKSGSFFLSGECILGNLHLIFYNFIILKHNLPFKECLVSKHFFMVRDYIFCLVTSVSYIGIIPHSDPYILKHKEFHFKEWKPEFFLTVFLHGSDYYI